jgi:hypothetical protein
MTAASSVSVDDAPGSESSQVLMDLIAAVEQGRPLVEDDLTTEHSITIDAPIARVWQALTTPETIKRWFFGVDTETDWRVGSPIVHRGEYQGKPYEDIGEILEIEPLPDWFTLTGARFPDFPTHPNTTSGSHGSCPRQPGMGPN